MNRFYNTIHIKYDLSNIFNKLITKYKESPFMKSVSVSFPFVQFQHYMDCPSFPDYIRNLDKSEQFGFKRGQTLTENQIKYAANHVRY